MTPEEKHRYTHFQEQFTFFVKRAQIKTLFPVFLVISGILYILVLLGSDIEFSKELPPARRGIVYNLGPDQAVRLNALRNRTPLDTYIPPWADPAHDTLEIAPLKPKRGIEPTPLPPCTSDDLAGSVGRHRALWYLTLPPAEMPPEYTPETLAAALAVPELVSAPEAWGTPITRPAPQQGDDIGWIGCSASFEIVLNALGTPEQIVLLDSSGSPQADTAAESIIRRMRWSPSTQPRNGILTLGWKEAQP